MLLCGQCGQCTRWQTARRLGRYTNTGHRDKSFGLAEITSTSAPTACGRSVLSGRLQVAGDLPVVFFSIDRTEQLPARLARKDARVCDSTAGMFRGRVSIFCGEHCKKLIPLLSSVAGRRLHWHMSRRDTQRDR